MKGNAAALKRGQKFRAEEAITDADREMAQSFTNPAKVEPRSIWDSLELQNNAHRVLHGVSYERKRQRECFEKLEKFELLLPEQHRKMFREALSKARGEEKE